MSDRFFLDPDCSTIEGELATLGGDEAHHFSRVMRGKAGDTVILFDGSGFFWRGVVQNVSKTAVSVRISAKMPDAIESPLHLTVASALPKGERQRFLVEKLAELGVKRFVPLQLDRSVAKADKKTTEKFRRYVVEAAKQCDRNVLMGITEEMSLQEFNALLETECTKLILHPVSLGEVGQTMAREIILNGMPKEIAVLVGPEGSFTDREVAQALQHGFKPVELGKRILRTETACIAAAALLLTYAG